MSKQFDVLKDTHLLIDTRQIPLDAVDRIKDEFTRSNPDFWKKKTMGFWLGDTPKEVYSWRHEGSFLILPRGTLDKIIMIMSQFGYELGNVRDSTLKKKSFKFEFTGNGTLRPYQRKAVDALVTAGGNGTIRGPCGSGKTISLIGAIVRLGQPAIVVVHTNALAQQWRGAILTWLGFHPGSVNSKIKNIQPVTVATQQTIWRLIEKGDVDWINEFGTIVGDEIHRWAARTFQTVASAFPAIYKIGASADERRKDGREHLVYETFGPPVDKITRQELTEIGKLLPIRMIVVPTSYVDIERIKTVNEGKIPDWPATLKKMVRDEDRNNLIFYTAINVLFGNLVDEQDEQKSSPTLSKFVEDHFPEDKLKSTAEMVFYSTKRLIFPETDTFPTLDEITNDDLDELLNYLKEYMNSGLTDGKIDRFIFRFYSLYKRFIRIKKQKIDTEADKKIAEFVDKNPEVKTLLESGIYLFFHIAVKSLIKPVCTTYSTDKTSRNKNNKYNMNKNNKIGTNKIFKLELKDLINRNYSTVFNGEMNNQKNSHASRKIKASGVKRHTSKILILTERVEVARYWVARFRRSGIPAGLMIGGPENRKEMEATYTGLQTGKILVGVGTKIADEGLDIPALSHVLVTCPVHSNKKRLEQMIGRTARTCEGETEGVCVYFWDWLVFPPLRSDMGIVEHGMKMDKFLQGFSRIVDRQELAIL